MKKLLSFSFLLVSLVASAQGNTVEDTTAKPAITEIGKPDGEKAEMKIGKQGGSLTSSDGKMKLIVPAGAVSKNTDFIIQPTSNLAPNGNGKSYQMEPSGINFQKPLQIIFYYSGMESDGNSPDLLGIAIQDDKGQWSSPDKSINDTIAKTLTAEVGHFSTFVLYYSAVISPASARVKVNGSLRLKINGVYNIDYGKGGPLVVRTESAEIWKVNGIQKGNSTVGLISASQDYSAIFQAPAQVPSQNPVAVTVTENMSGVASAQWNVYTLVSNITIFDGDYEVKFITTMKGGTIAAWGGATTYKDHGSFIVSLEGKEPKVTEIKNHLETLEDNCAKTLLNPGKNTGILHITALKLIKVTPAEPPTKPYAFVEILFVQTNANFSKYKYNCPPPPGHKGRAIGDNVTQAYLMDVMIPGLPVYVKFFAKDEEQVIEQRGKEGGELYYKIWVNKIK